MERYELYTYNKDVFNRQLEHKLCYNVLPGTEIIVNEAEKNHSYKFKSKGRGYFEIYHCMKGRLEYTRNDGKCVCIESGDIMLMYSDYKRNVSVPEGDGYYGISVEIEIGTAEKAVYDVTSSIFGYPISVKQLAERLCQTECMVIRSHEASGYIFYDLYNVREAAVEGYCRLKVLELLLFLDGYSGNEFVSDKMYFYKDQVEIVRKAKKYLIDNLDRHITLEELAKKFYISQTALKSIFKNIYGAPVDSYMREYRMNTAEYLLKTTELSVSEIAAKVGYESPSRFSAVYKKYKNQSPSGVRKIAVSIS